MGRLTPEMRPRRRSTADSVDLGGDTLLYDGTLLRRLVGTAAIIWRLVDGARSAADIAAELAQAYPEVASQVEQDVLDFLDELAEYALLRLFEPDSAPRYARPSHVAYVVEDGVTYLADLRRSARQALSPTGSRVWQLICDEPDARVVVQRLQAEYPDAGPAVAVQVQALLDDLVEAELLVRRG